MSTSSVSALNADVAKHKRLLEQAESETVKFIDLLGDAGIRVASVEMAVPVVIGGVEIDPVTLTFTTEERG